MLESDKEEKSSRSSSSASTGGRWSEIRFTLHFAMRNPLIMAGAIIVVVSVVLAAFSGIIVNPHAWKTVNYGIKLCWNNSLINWHISNIFTCPGKTVYPLGTDNYGRNLLQMIILALPTDLEIAFTIVISAFAIGVVLGSFAAYSGGVTDEAILRITDVFFAIPVLILAIVVLATIGRTLEILEFSVLITWWPIYVRLVRSQVLSEKQKPYVEALRSVGAGNFRILFFHVLPNSIYPVLVQFTLDIGGVILVFSSLMFLGFSPSPLFPELGNLVSNGINNVFTAPWLIIFPGLTILIIALGFNLLGDGIRDILDPRLRR